MSQSSGGSESAQEKQKPEPPVKGGSGSHVPESQDGVNSKLERARAEELELKAKALQAATENAGASSLLPRGRGEIETSKAGGMDFFQAVGSGMQAPRASWASESSSDESVRRAEVDWFFLGQGVAGNVVYVPGDLDSVYPRGYEAVMKSAKMHNLVVQKNDFKLTQCGLRHKECFSADIVAAKKKLDSLEKGDQSNVIAFMTMFLLLDYLPTSSLISETRTCVPTSYVMSLFLREVYQGVSLAKAMKHEDGGRSIVYDRIAGCFQSDKTVVSSLMTTFDKLLRSNSRAFAKNADKDLVSMAERLCLTSDEGILQNHFKTVRRFEVVKTGSGKSATQKSVPKVGRVVPNLQVSSDLLKESEKNRLKELSNGFNLFDMYKADIAESRSIADKLEIAEELVKKAYQVTDPIVSMIRRRKNLIRAQITPPKLGAPITTEMWSKASVAVISESEEIAERVYESIANFCSH